MTKREFWSMWRCLENSKGRSKLCNKWMGPEVFEFNIKEFRSNFMRSEGFLCDAPGVVYDIIEGSAVLKLS